MTPNAAAFSHPAWMRAVLAHVTDARVFLDDAAGGPFALFAGRKQGAFASWIESSRDPLVPCPLPVVTRVPTAAEANAFLDGLAAPLILRGVPADNTLTKVLLQGAPRVKVLRTWQRAALDVSGSFDAWFMANFDHKRRKEFKRLKSRLAEQGTLSLDILAAGDSLAPHLVAFLTLEASGWKGRRGTAVLNNAHAAAGLDAGLAAMHAQNRVRFWTLRLNGEPLASLFALVDGGEAVLGKMGYDEAFAKYSPGVLLIIEATKCLFAEAGIRLADANAMPGHPMIDRIWRDRLDCMDVILAGAAVSSLRFAATTARAGIKDATRHVAKQAYLRFSGRKAS
jgi:CelD/BcsL family acetyltransferase involved in cellulose biosynthesis